MGIQHHSAITAATPTTSSKHYQRHISSMTSPGPAWKRQSHIYLETSFLLSKNRHGQFQSGVPFQTLSPLAPSSQPLNISIYNICQRGPVKCDINLVDFDVDFEHIIAQLDEASLQHITKSGWRHGVSYVIVVKEKTFMLNKKHNLKSGRNKDKKKGLNDKRRQETKKTEGIDEKTTSNLIH